MTLRMERMLLLKIQSTTDIQTSAQELQSLQSPERRLGHGLFNSFRVRTDCLVVSEMPRNGLTTKPEKSMVASSRHANYVRHLARLTFNAILEDLEGEDRMKLTGEKSWTLIVYNYEHWRL